MNDKSSFGKTVSDDQREHKAFSNSAYEQAPVLEEQPVARQIDGAGELLAEAASMDDEGVEELRPTREQERRGERDYSWDRRSDLDHPEGLPLAGEERMLAREQEMERQRERALAADEAGVDRAQSSREQTRQEFQTRHEDFEARADVAAGRAPDADPRDGLDAETLAEVNRAAQDLAREFESAPSAAALSKRVAEALDDDRTVGEAMIDVRSTLIDEDGVITPVREIPNAPWVEDYEITRDIQGTVDVLFAPKNTSQQQVGYIIDESGGSIKVTIWQNSRCGTVLRDGDTVRIRNGVIGHYKGDRTIAVTSDSRVEIIERGDGPAPIHGHLTNVEFEESGDRVKQVDRKDTKPSKSSSPEGALARAEQARARHRRATRLREAADQALIETMVPASQAPAWWVAQDRVVEVDGEAVLSASDGE